MNRWLLALLVASCGGETIDIGSNAGRPGAPVALRCGAPASAPQPPATSSAHDGNAIGARLMTARWILCPGDLPPAGLAERMDLAPGASFSLRRDETGAFVHDAPLSITTAWSLRYLSFEFAVPGQPNYLVWFEEAPLRMFISSPKDPHAPIAKYVVF